MERLLLVFCLIIFPQIHSTSGDGGGPQDDPKTLGNPPLSKLVADTISILKRSHESYWEKIKTIVHEMQSQFSPPNLDFRGSEEAKAEIENGAGGKMKEAAGKSFESCKETVEESAKSAAEVVGHAVHETAQVVKEGMIDAEHHHDEL
ncbi:hypothetical protein HS088_TW07G00772 [Tripterygium wilfordii]|uniref:Uncharacterized protein n=1 Tax=Tripterygium wilfordii TaxID=458696 RepID=A0A7J7DFP9_TRIWF|nr:uncharacterized protein LOC120002502 [Tripterygium wilfordii]KAF5745190.1 hypothetical protein HS088_TW07G00772 [Tripterygium wilfordii]